MSDNTQITAIQEEYSGELESIDVEQPCPVVETDEAVITTLSRLIFRDKAVAKIELQANYLRQKANEWEKGEIEKIEKQKAWLQVPLQSFMESINRSNPKIKSLKFPVGKIGLRSTPQKIEIDADFVPDEHCGEKFIIGKTTYTVSKKDIKKQLDETGEIPDYASVIPGEQRFYYKAGE